MAALSHRLSHNHPTNQITRAIEVCRGTGTRLIDLTESNPTVALRAYPHEPIGKAFGAVRDFTYHPDAKGTLSARQALAKDYAARGLCLDPTNLFLTASTSEAYTHIFKLLCDPGDSVLSPAPSYPLFEHLAALASVEIKPYRLLYDGSWHIDLDHLRTQVHARTKAIVIVNPNNPTGHYVHRSELTALQQLGLPLISDEVFLDFPLNDRSERPWSVADDSDLPSFTLGGLSKFCGMPQMKLAWTIASGPPEFRASATQTLELMMDAYLSVNTVVQQALPDLLAIGAELRHNILGQVRSNWQTLRSDLAGTAANPLHLEGGWSAIVRLPSMDDEETWVLRLLREKNVIVQPGFFFDMSGGPHIVVSLLSRPDVFAKGTAALRQLLT